jgi:apolipoprotein N-acyltransferase
MSSPLVTSTQLDTSSARASTRVANPTHRRFGLPLLLALTTGVALWLCFFPVNAGWLAWVALVPMLVLVRSRSRPRGLYLSAWVGGLVFFWPVLQWMRVADPRMAIAWGVLATYCSLYFPLVLWLLRFLEHRTRLPLVLGLPIVWTALEYFRSYFGNDFFGSGFSWYQLGHTQHDFLPLIQVADLAGVYAVSFLVLMVNALLFEVLDGRRWFRRLYGAADVPARWGRPTVLLQGVAIVMLLLADLGYGVWRMGQAAFTVGPRVALLQGNLGQQLRNDLDAGDSCVDHFVQLCDLAADYHPDLIVWPETSYPYEWMAVAPEVAPGDVPGVWQSRDNNGREFAITVAKRWQTNVLMGLNAQILEPDGKARRYNSALLVDSSGNASGRYDKIHCVPFGEYVPFKDTLPFMSQLAPYDYEYSVSQGRAFTRFPLSSDGQHTYHFGIVICYEDTDPAVSRPYGGGDGRPAADFIFNISNDGWFDGTSEHDQHLAICRFRAIECRRTVARAVNMGISAVIDGNGRVLQPENRPLPAALTEAALRKAGLRTPLLRVWEVLAQRAEELPVARWGEFKKVPGILLASLPLDERTSLYVYWGDWLPWGCWLAIGGCGILSIVRRVQSIGVR